MIRDYRTCADCIDYMADRHKVILPELVRTLRRDETSRDRLDRYMSQVHDRHLSGLSLAVA